MSFDWLVNLDYGLPKEDIVIVLDIEPHISYKRGHDNGFVLDEFEKDMSFLEKTRENYLELAKRFKWVVIDSRADVKSLSESIANIIEMEK